MTDAERVALLIEGLNKLAVETGLTVVGTTTSPLALRIVNASYVDSPTILGPTIDAAHWISRRWVDGAAYRRASDPVWADKYWGKDKNRRAGNERLPGDGPKNLDHTEKELQDFATRDGKPVE